MRKSDARSEQELLAFRGITTIQAQGSELPVQLDSSGRSCALASDLLESYELPFAWDESHRRVLIGAMDLSPTFPNDGVQDEVGWLLFEMSLHSASAPVILRGILRPGTDGARAWCRVVEFAKEFGISVGFDPLRLGESLGG